MVTSAQGIAGKVALFAGVVRAHLHIFLVNDADEPIPNLKCEVVFQDGQTIRVESDAEGVLKFPRKAEGEFDLKLLEEGEPTTESKSPM